MRKMLFIMTLILTAAGLNAQKIEEGFDAFFAPTKHAFRYYVITEKKDTLWHRQVYYIPERSLAMEGWYKDKEGKTAQGEVSWYHPNKFLKSSGNYLNGKKEGAWVEFGEEGRMRDSAWYEAGKVKGVRLRWYPDGMPADSMQFDGAGNGVQVSWYESGAVSSAGYWVSDTIKKGRWKYYHENGTVKAVEDYVNGQRISGSCYDEAGQKLDSATCSEKEASFPNGDNGWRLFVQRNLNATVPVKMGAPAGQYTVMVQFVVDTEGRLEKIRSLTRFGFGMEEEVERLLRASPRWLPAQQFGRKVKAYRKQPVTFVISNG